VESSKTLVSIAVKKNSTVEGRLGQVNRGNCRDAVAPKRYEKPGARNGAGLFLLQFNAW